MVIGSFEIIQILCARVGAKRTKGVRVRRLELRGVVVKKLMSYLCKILLMVRYKLMLKLIDFL